MVVWISIVVGLALALVLFSAFAATLMEILAATTSMRAKHLHETLGGVLGHISQSFFDHPFYRQMLRKKGPMPYGTAKLPDRISRRNFSLILFDILELEQGKDPLTALHALPHSEIKQVLLFFNRQSGHNLTKFRLLVENWFDEAMKGCTATYRIKTQGYLFGIGVLLAFLFNADLLQLCEQLGAFAAEGTLRTGNQHATLPMFGRDMSLIPIWLSKITGYMLMGLGVAFIAPVWFDWSKRWMYRRGGQIWEDLGEDAYSESIATGLELQADLYKAEPESEPTQAAPKTTDPPPNMEMKAASREADISIEELSVAENEKPESPLPPPITVPSDMGTEAPSREADTPIEESPVAENEKAKTPLPPPIVFPPIDKHKLNWALRNSLIPTEYWENQAVRGEKITVAILGTGASITHPDLQGAIAQTWAFDGSNAAESIENIGTQAALLVAARGTFSYGVVPQANLLVAKIGENERNIQVSDAIAGLDWAINQEADIVAILADFRMLNPPDRITLEKLIQKALNKNILLIAPVGNGTGPKPEESFPAALDGVLSVGAHDPHQDQSLFSSRSYRLDILAPGEELSLANTLGGYGVNIRSTSAAAAFVAGTAALYKGICLKHNKVFEPPIFIERVRKTAKPRNPLTKGKDVAYGHGILSLADLLELSQKQQ